MSVISLNPTGKEIQQNDLPAKILPFRSKRVAETEPGVKLALAWLKTSIASPKEFALRLGIGERQVYKWINQEASIPKDRIETILWAAISFMAPLFCLREETDHYLLKTYHPKNLREEASVCRF